MDSTQTILPVALLLAVSKAKQELGKVARSGENKHLKNKYATLDDILEEIEPVLHEHELIQYITCEGTSVTLVVAGWGTGEYLTSTLDMAVCFPEGCNPHALGGFLTYAHRYLLRDFFSIRTGEDDDGEAAMQRGKALPLTPSASSATVSTAKKRML